jgi:hypothetical protein
MRPCNARHGPGRSGAGALRSVDLRTRDGMSLALPRAFRPLLDSAILRYSVPQLPLTPDGVLSRSFGINSRLTLYAM